MVTIDAAPSMTTGMREARRVSEDPRRCNVTATRVVKTKLISFLSVFAFLSHFQTTNSLCSTLLPVYQGIARTESSRIYTDFDV
jgi:hypothetical protein